MSAGVVDGPIGVVVGRDLSAGQVASIVRTMLRLAAEYEAEAPRLRDQWLAGEAAGRAGAFRSAVAMLADGPL